MARLTVVTVCFNSARTIGDTLRSIKGLSDQGLQHVVVDGGSDDATLDIVREHIAPGDTLISERDKGIYDAMNKGIRAAEGDYIGFLNSDDYFAEPHALSAILDAVKGGGPDCLWGDVVQIDPSGRARRYISGRSFAPWMIGIGVMPPHPSFYMRTSLLRDMGGFSTDYGIAGDFEMMVRLFGRADLVWRYVPGLVTVMRLGGVSSAGWKAHRRTSNEVADVLRRHGRRVASLRIAARYPLRVLEFARAKALGNRNYSQQWFASSGYQRNEREKG